MGKTLTEIAQQLKNANKKVQLIYAFNGAGKTRLSQVFRDPKTDIEEDGVAEPSRRKFLYYNAFTEDLFYWDNDISQDFEPKPKLKIQPNSFTDWILRERGDTDIGRAQKPSATFLEENVAWENYTSS